MEEEEKPFQYNADFSGLFLEIWRTFKSLFLSKYQNANLVYGREIKFKKKFLKYPKAYCVRCPSEQIWTIFEHNTPTLYNEARCKFPSSTYIWKLNLYHVSIDGQLSILAFLSLIVEYVLT